jgi:uncharacterized protein YdaU (DUF1376 family)
MPRKDPAMPLYCDDWLASPRVQCMTLEEEGAYLRLLMFCWMSGDCSIPDDDIRLSILSRMVDKWLTNGCPLVRQCFQPHPDKKGFLTNARLYGLWLERQEWRAKSRAGGAKSAANRKLQIQPPLSNGCPLVEPPLQPKGNTPSPSPSPSKYIFTPPTVTQVAEYCRERDNGIDPELFVSSYASKGWMVGNHKMKDWKQAVITFERNKAAREAPPKPFKCRPLTSEEMARDD